MPISKIQQHRSNPVGLIRSSFRKDSKVYQATYERITGLSLEQLRLIQAAFQRRVVPTPTNPGPAALCHSFPNTRQGNCKDCHRHRIRISHNRASLTHRSWEAVQPARQNTQVISQYRLSTVQHAAEFPAKFARCRRPEGMGRTKRV